MFARKETFFIVSGTLVNVMMMMMMKILSFVVVFGSVVGGAFYLFIFSALQLFIL